MHRELAAGRWQTFPLHVQLAHVGSEVERALNWRLRGDTQTSLHAFERGLELLDLTIADPRWRRRLKELCRVREVLVDFFVGTNTYESSSESLRAYFTPFTIRARRRA